MVHAERVLHPYDTRADSPVRFQRRVQGKLHRQLVVRHHRRDLHAARIAGCQAIGIRRVKVKLVEGAARRHIGMAHSRTVAVGFVRDVEHSYALDKWLPASQHGGAARYVWIHARSTDVLSDFLQHKNVNLGKRNARHQAFGLLQQQRFFLCDSFTWNRLNMVCIMKCVLQNGQPKRDLPRLDYRARKLHDVLRHIWEAQLVACRRAPLLTQTYDDHLHQAAFHRPTKIRVRLHPSHWNDPVRLTCITVQIYREPILRSSEYNRLYIREDARTHALLRYAVCRKNTALALCRSPTMAAHGGYDEWQRAVRLEYVQQGPDDTINISNFTASHCYTHRVARSDAGKQI